MVNRRQFIDISDMTVACGVTPFSQVSILIYSRLIPLIQHRMVLLSCLAKLKHCSSNTAIWGGEIFRPAFWLLRPEIVSSWAGKHVERRRIISLDRGRINPGTRGSAQFTLLTLNDPWLVNSGRGQVPFLIAFTAISLELNGDLLDLQCRMHKSIR